MTVQETARYIVRGLSGSIAKADLERNVAWVESELQTLIECEFRAEGKRAERAEAELAAFKTALCLRGENPDTLTPTKAREFLQCVYDCLEALEATLASSNKAGCPGGNDFHVCLDAAPAAALKRDARNEQEETRRRRATDRIVGAHASHG